MEDATIQNTFKDMKYHSNVMYERDEKMNMIK